MQNHTLFLDRDGVINQRIPDAYVNHWDDFRFHRGAVEAIVRFSQLFERIIVVTNQQGIGKGIMTVHQLNRIHQRMEEALVKAGGRIDGIYFCGDLKSQANNCRKPAPAMALQAQKDFPAIDFQQSIMVGDSISDLQFGRKLGMKTVLITTKLDEKYLWEQHQKDWDYQFESLAEMARKVDEVRN